MRASLTLRKDHVSGAITAILLLPAGDLPMCCAGELAGWLASNPGSGFDRGADAEAVSRLGAACEAHPPLLPP